MLCKYIIKTISKEFGIKFLICSRKLMGHVFERSLSKIGFLEIGKILPSFHCLGIDCCIRYLLKRAVIAWKKESPVCLIIS